MRFEISSPLDINGVTGKFMRVGYRYGESKTYPHPAPCHAYLFLYQLTIEWKIT